MVVVVVVCVTLAPEVDSLLFDFDLDFLDFFFFGFDFEG